MVRPVIGAPGWGTTLNADLDGIEDLAQAAYDIAAAGGGGGGGSVLSVNTQTGTVVLDADDIADGTTQKMLTATERTKLAGIASGATVNATDTFLRARANHTGTQAQSTITNLTTDLAAKANLTHSHTVADMPAGTVIGAKWTGSAWPARPTSRTDIIVQWMGGTEASPPPALTDDIWVRSAV